MKRPELSPSWATHLNSEMEKPYFQDLMKFLESERNAGKKIFPDFSDIFAALNATPLEKVKVVILGQDPYHGEGQAHGLSFSVKKGIKTPPSLVNIYKELSDDLKLPTPSHGDLSQWSSQGVLLLNNVLTVEVARPGSHHKKGWETFTDKIIEVLNEKRENLVFILWGNPAQVKAKKVDEKKHFVIKSVHPSPLSSYRGFFGSKPFSQANKFLEAKGAGGIDWSVT